MGVLIQMNHCSAHSLLPSGSPFGDLFSAYGSPKGPLFLSRSPFFLFQAEERAKSQNIHYYPWHLHIKRVNFQRHTYLRKMAQTCTKWSHILRRCFSIILLLCISINWLVSINLQNTLFGSPFMLAKVPIRSPSHSKLGPHWVLILNKIGSPWHFGAVLTMLL